jgi:hypothetical protein
MRNLILIPVLISIVLVSGCAYFANDDIDVPEGAIHWHPNLKIIINGEEQVIPNDMGTGHGTGLVIDTHLSGMGMSPIHTHGEGDGTLHMEQTKPNAETLTLGYFFKVWDKPFNETCIFEFCNTDDKKVSMTVNGVENTQFGKYVMHDKDKIVITYG